MKRTLAELKVGEKACVVGLNCKGLFRRRLLDMGITPGTNIYVRKLAPLGDPIELTIRGYELTIREKEASEIEITTNTMCNGDCKNCKKKG